MWVDYKKNTKEAIWRVAGCIWYFGTPIFSAPHWPAHKIYKSADGQ